MRGFARNVQKLPADRSVGVDVACSRDNKNSNEGRSASGWIVVLLVISGRVSVWYQRPLLILVGEIPHRQQVSR
jgi:hypothetical protein